jgi:hypothetical protein
MANSANEVFLPGLAAASDLSSNKGYVVKYASTVGQVKVVTATTDEAVGILDNEPERAGEGALVQVDGVAKAVAGTSVGWTANVSVGYNTTGKVVPIAYNGTNDNRRIIGKYPLTFGNTTTVAVNQVVSVQLFGGVQRA